MRKLLFIATALLVMTSCDDKPVAPTELPQEVQTFIKQNFPSQTITFAQKDPEWIFFTQYEVTLNDGTQVSFDTDNVWDKVESRTGAVPAALVPQPIATYVNTNFPAVAIVKIDKESYGYEVELANELELKFNEGGALMEMDD